MIAEIRKRVAGQAASIRLEKMQVECIIKDVRRRFNHTDILIVPRMGSGSMWVVIERCVVPPDVTQAIALL